VNEIKRILVRAYTAKNLGDDLFLRILIERYPKTLFKIIAPTSYLEHFASYENVEFVLPPTFTMWERIINKLFFRFSKKFILKQYYKIWKAFFQDQLTKIDIYLSIGGSIFIQNSTDLLTIDQIIYKISVEIFEKKPKLIIGANFGPYKTQTFVDEYKLIFSKYDDICFRDQYSKNLFPLLPNIRVNPDIVFQLKLPNIEKNAKNVGFSLIDISNREDLKNYENEYLETISNLIITYIANGYYPYLFSFCKAEGDENAIAKLLNKLPIDFKLKVKSIFYNGDIDNFLRIFGSMDIMYSTRFHAMILSLLFKQKIYPIIYSNKVSNVLKDLNYAGSYSRIEELGTLDTKKIMSEVNKNKLSIGDMPLDAEKQFIKLDKILYNN